MSEWTEKTEFDSESYDGLYIGQSEQHRVVGDMFVYPGTWLLDEYGSPIIDEYGSIITTEILNV